MKLKLIGLTVALVMGPALAVAATAAENNRFDLRCTPQTKDDGIGVRRFMFDLDSGVFCETLCGQTQKIYEITPVKIVLENVIVNDKPENCIKFPCPYMRDIIYINRLTGTWVHEITLATTTSLPTTRKYMNCVKEPSTMPRQLF